MGIFFQAREATVLLRDCTTLFNENARWKFHKDAAFYFERILEVATYKITAIQPLFSHDANYRKTFVTVKSSTAGEVRTNS